MSLGRIAAARRELCHRPWRTGGTRRPAGPLGCRRVPARSPSTCISNHVTYYLLADVRQMIPPTPNTTFIYRLSRMCVALPDVLVDVSDQSLYEIDKYILTSSVCYLLTF